MVLLSSDPVSVVTSIITDTLRVRHPHTIRHTQKPYPSNEVTLRFCVCASVFVCVCICLAWCIWLYVPHRIVESLHGVWCPCAMPNNEYPMSNFAFATATIHTTHTHHHHICYPCSTFSPRCSIFIVVYVEFYRWLRTAARKNPHCPPVPVTWLFSVIIEKKTKGLGKLQNHTIRNYIDFSIEMFSLILKFFDYYYGKGI